MARVVFNKISINKKVNGALTQRRFIGLARSAANTRFIAGQQGIVKEFDNHVITNELQQGASAGDSVLGYGNLAAFLGLPDSNQAVEELKDYLISNIQMDSIPKFEENRFGITYVFDVEAPSLQEIYDATPPPPDSYNKSWVSVIENGMGNFSYFVFRLLGLPGSRSGTGLQREKKRKWVDVSNSSPKIKWVSEILTNFLNRFSRR